MGIIRRIVRHLPLALICFFFAALVVKLFWSLFVYDVPLGYDPGIYRYLFVKHAEAFPPFVLGNVEAWARGHPIGMFIFSSPFIKAGVPVSWFLGWIWNAFSVFLIVSLAWVSTKSSVFNVWFGKQYKPFVALVFMMAVLSQPYYNGFSAMYWKSFVAMFFMLLTFYFIEKKSWWAVLPAGLTLITHNQVGLLFALTMGLWWAVTFAKNWRNPLLIKATIAGVLIFIIASIFYLPIYKEALLDHLVPLLTKRGEDVPSGSFPPAEFYIRTYAILLLFGTAGFILSVAREKWLTLWHFAILWAAAFVTFKLYFHSRFFLQLDFFLLPFAALAFYLAWKKWKSIIMRFLLLFLILIQGLLAYKAMLLRTPDLDTQTYALVNSVEQYLPENSYVIALENMSTLWLRGWLPNHRVAGPGLLTISWDYSKWEALIYGTHKQRKALLETLKGPVYFVLTPLFYSHYQQYAQPFLNDSCLEEVKGAPLYLSKCSP